jgi:hypothetical protein
MFHSFTFNSEALMESHVYRFEPRDVLLLLAAPLLPVLLFSGVYYGANASGVLPKPRPTFDADQTIVVHQAEMSRRRNGANLVLVGDSSCLMDIAALPLGERLSVPTLNLGTLSLLGIDNFAEIVAHQIKANPDTVRMVVLAVHPEALRRVTPEARYVRFLRNFYDGIDTCEAADVVDKIVCATGIDSFRNRIVSRLVPSPLSGSYGRVYGFSADLERYMTREAGTVVEPTRDKFSGSAEYWLAEKAKPASATFRRAVPSSIKLAVVITPVPASFALPGYPAHYQEMLREWSQWISADLALTNLPGTLPDENFARVTHLNAEGMKTYTELLAQELKSLIP